MKLPIEFNASTVLAGSDTPNWSTVSLEGQSSVCVPKDFGGPGGALSPEDLFNHALVNCFLATFKVYAQNSKLTFQRIEVSSRLIVDKGQDLATPVMKSFFAKVKISGTNNPERARLLVQKAINSGFILNSVKTEKNFEVTVE